jgi:hypothetical protein
MRQNSVSARIFPKTYKEHWVPRHVCETMQDRDVMSRIEMFMIPRPLFFLLLLFFQSVVKLLPVCHEQCTVGTPTVIDAYPFSDSI